MKVLLDDEIDLNAEPPVFSTIVYTLPGVSHEYTVSATSWMFGWRSTNLNYQSVTWETVREDILGGHAVALFIPEEQ